MPRYLAAAAEIVPLAWRVKRAHGVPIVRQARDLALLRRTTGMSRHEFYGYRLWRPGLSLRQRLEFASNLEHWPYECRFNDVAWHWLVVRKGECARRLAAAGIAVPRLLATVGPAADAAATGVPHLDSPAALAEFAGALGDDWWVLKPDDAGQGDDVVVAVHSDRAGLIGIDLEPQSWGEIWHAIVRRAGPAWRIEAHVAAHPALPQLRPGPTPTIRVLTLLVGGRVVIHAATLKVPLKPIAVDNFCRGQLGAPIDPDSGIVGAAVTHVDPAPRRHHPVTGEAIAGIAVPDWRRVVSTAHESARVFGRLGAVAWDIAVTPGGTPVVLEGNVTWAQEIVQLPQDRGLIRDALIEGLAERGDAGVLQRRWRRTGDAGWRGSAAAAGRQPGEAHRA